MLREEQEMFLDIFDLDGDGKLNAVEMATAYTVIFGEDAWSGPSREDEVDDDLLPDAEDDWPDGEEDY